MGGGKFCYRNQEDEYNLELKIWAHYVDRETRQRREAKHLQRLFISVFFLQRFYEELRIFEVHISEYLSTFSRAGDVAVYVFDINQQSLPTPFCSVLVSISSFMALSTVLQSINSPDNSPLSHSVLLVLSLPYWSFYLSSSL